MKNCNGDAEELQKSILNIIKHYQVCFVLKNGSFHLLYACILQPQEDHSNCYAESFCRKPNYAPSKVPLTDPQVIEVYENALRETSIFQYAEHYLRVCKITCTAIYYANTPWICSHAVP